MVAMRMPIPLEMREELSLDPYMRGCICRFSSVSPCEGRIEWNHSMTYKGKRITEIWALLPMCSRHHKEQARFRREIEICLKYRIKHFNALADFHKKYPRSDLFKV